VQVLAACAAAAGFGVAPVLILATALLEVMVAPARITDALTVTSSGLAVGLSVAAPAAGVLIDEVSARSGYLIVSGAALGTALLMMIAAKPLHRLESHG
jgi:predicted MFS family arabinose efflux permease